MWFFRCQSAVQSYLYRDTHTHYTHTYTLHTHTHYTYTLHTHTHYTHIHTAAGISVSCGVLKHCFISPATDTHTHTQSHRYISFLWCVSKHVFNSSTTDTHTHTTHIHYTHIQPQVYQFPVVCH